MTCQQIDLSTELICLLNCKAYTEVYNPKWNRFGKALGGEIKVPLMKVRLWFNNCTTKILYLGLGRGKGCHEHFHAKNENGQA